MALAAAGLLAVAGCAPAPAADAASATSHAVTLAAARAAYDGYLAASNAAAASGNELEALKVVADAEAAQVKAQYTALESAGTPLPRYRYGTPVFYVPALAGYPQWFVVAVPRSTAGSRGPAVRTLLLFTRYAAADPWTLSGTAVLGQPLPAIARDVGGYAIGVAASDPALLLPPDLLGATQAAVADDGPASPAAAVISRGPLTTGLYAAQRAMQAAQQANGLDYQWLLQGASYQQFELRLADGGALVLYPMDLNTTYTRASQAAGPPIPVPASFAPLLTAPAEAGLHEVGADWTYEFAAVDPPASAPHASVQVIGGQGAPTYGYAN